MPEAAFVDAAAPEVVAAAPALDVWIDPVAEDDVIMEGFISEVDMIIDGSIEEEVGIVIVGSIAVGDIVICAKALPARRRAEAMNVLKSIAVGRRAYRENIALEVKGRSDDDGTRKVGNSLACECRYGRLNRSELFAGLHPAYAECILI